MSAKERREREIKMIKEEFRESFEDLKVGLTAIAEILPEVEELTEPFTQFLLKKFKEGFRAGCDEALTEAAAKAQAAYIIELKRNLEKEFPEEITRNCLIEASLLAKGR